MALVSSRLAMANSLVTLLQGITDPNTSQPLYPLVKLGMVFDPGALTAFVGVWHYRGHRGKAGSGGNQIQWRSEDDVTFILTSGTGPYELNDSTAESAMLHIQDIMPPAIETHFQLPDASNPSNAIQSVYSVVLDQDDVSPAPQKFPNGHVYKIWHQFVKIKQAYNVQLVQP
jgi:hypothetical protein